MKKILLITIPLIVILILIGIWAYMLLYNEPGQTNTDIFSNFNFFGDQATTPIDRPEPETDNEPQVNVGASPLRQLTTRPVIGFTEVFATTSQPHFVTYAEAGTGHIYQINMGSGEEVRISNTTIPNASHAVFSADGQAVAMRSGFNTNSEVIYGTLNNDGGLDNRTLSNGISNLSFTTDGNLLYSEVTASGLRARKLDATTQSISTVFELPFREVTIIWGREPNSSHHVYTKPSANLRSYLYRIDDDNPLRQPISGTGITASANENFIVYHELLSTEHIGFVYDKVLNTQVETPIVPIADKCAFSNSTSGLLYCGYDFTIYDYEFPDSWHKGTISFSDRIWEIDLRNGSAEQLSNPKQTTGREIDIIDMTASANTRMLYFINKNDQTLWSYER